jgi:hypothetical protein
MRNPWMAKNPFLSMWLSAAASMLGAAQGHAANAVRRQQQQWMNESAKAFTSLWAGTTPPARSRKRRKT